MAQSTGTLDRDTLATDGNKFREDLSDVIYNISPTETPMQSNIGMETSGEVLKEWVKDSLATASENAHIDGDEFSGDTLTTGARLANWHQISRKDIVVTRRANRIRKAGRRSEMAYQIAKGGKEIKRDIEVAITRRHEAITSDNSGTRQASQTAGVSAWLTTNDSRGGSGTSPTLSGGNDGYPNAVGTTGSNRVLSQANLLGVCEDCYDEGGNPNMVQVSPAIKSVMSNFYFTVSGARLATPYQDHGASPRGGISAVGAVDTYVTDFQVLDIVPNRFSPGATIDIGGTDTATENEAQVIDTDYWAISDLTGYQVVDIAKIGDHERSMLLRDYALCSKNEAASGVVADLTTGAMTA